MFRTARRRLWWFVVPGLGAVLYGLMSSTFWFWIGVELLVGSAGLYWLVRFAHLRQTIDGTLRWTIGPSGIRVEGYVITEVPWREVARWYVAGDHLVIGVRRHTGGRSKMLHGLGAPVEAFSDEQMARTRALLEEHVGREYE